LGRLAYGTIKSLMHFDFPYHGEPNSGLRDEIGLETWEKQGNTKFVNQGGTAYLPNDETVAGTPQFGYRCAQFAAATDYISGTNNTGIWNLSSGGLYEVEAFIRPTSSAGGNVFQLLLGNGAALTMALNSSRRVILTSEILGLNITSADALALDTFTWVLLRFSGGTATLYFGEQAEGVGVMTDGAALTPTQVRLGGFVGQMDEFCFRHSVRVNPTVPTAPYQGTLNVQKVGGFGNGSWGDVVLPTGTVNINTTALVTATSDSTNVTVGTPANGLYGAFAVGQEIMLHLSLKKATDETQLGKYDFAKITNINGSNLTLDHAPGEFPLNAQTLEDYYVQVIQVPNFNTLTLPAETTVIPRTWDTTSGGGMAVFRVLDTCSINGKILCAGKGPARTDTLQLTHSSIADQFILTGNAFIVVKNTLSVSGKIGSDFDGALYAGAKGSTVHVGTGVNQITDGGVGRGGHGCGGGSSAAPGGEGGDPGFPGKGGANRQTQGTPKGDDGVVGGPNLIIVAGALSAEQSSLSTGGGGGGSGGDYHESNNKPGPGFAGGTLSTGAGQGNSTMGGGGGGGGGGGDAQTPTSGLNNGHTTLQGKGGGAG
jgi:hypothetical protein